MRKNEKADTILVYKEQGETMGQVTQRVRDELNIPDSEKITFAGRLDPMARGLVLFLRGDERFKKEKYLKLKKKYQFEIVFGAETDTGDALGLVQNIDKTPPILTESLLADLFRNSLGSQEQTYPTFSSKTVKGKPLFMYAREGSSVELPKRQVEIYSLKLLRLANITKENFISNIHREINNVAGDFRQPEIIERWNEVHELLPEQLQIATCQTECSSGTYVRTLAQTIGREVGTAAIAHDINRLQIGTFTN